MAQYVLEILDGDRAGDVLPLSESPLRIGRRPGNDLVFADEKTSGSHAEITFEGGRHVLRDLGSTNGTLLDGKRITELVLSVGDVVTLGRWRVCYRAAGGAAVAGASASGELAMRQLDMGRVKGRGGSAALLGGLLVAALGAGGYLWWQGQAGSDAGGEGPRGPKRREPLVVAGNKLGPALAQCETEDGWQLRLAGLGFQLGGGAHSGRSALVAQRAEGDPQDHAVAALGEPIAVLSNRPLVLRGHARTAAGGECALRAEFFASNDPTALRFRTGSPFRACDDWTELSVELAVPPGCDRMQVELVALLPGLAAEAAFDDLAVLEEGGSRPLDLRLEESKQTAVGTGAALAVRSTDPDNPLILLGLLPGKVRAELAALQAAGRVCLSDLAADGSVAGLRPTLVASPHSFQVKVDGIAAVQWLFPAEAAGSLMVRSAPEAPFVATAPEGEFTASALLLGSRATRSLLLLPAPVRCQGAVSGGVYALTIDGASGELQLGFATERQQALALLQQARERAAAQQPGEALDRLRELVGTAPHDSETLSQAAMLRTQLLGEQVDRLRLLQAELAEASFYDTRGGYQRVLAGADQLVASYAEHNLEDSAALAALRTTATERLQRMDDAQRAVERSRLEALVAALEGGQQRELARVVQDYVQRQLGGK
jgi:hypothetical protein